MIDPRRSFSIIPSNVILSFKDQPLIKAIRKIISDRKLVFLYIWIFKQGCFISLLLPLPRTWHICYRCCWISFGLLQNWWQRYPLISSPLGNLILVNLLKPINQLTSLYGPSLTEHFILMLKLISATDKVDWDLHRIFICICSKHRLIICF